jgi:hypothetical protein
MQVNRRGAVIALYMTVVVAIVLSAAALFNFLNHGDVFGQRTQNNEQVIEQTILAHEYIEGTARIIIADSVSKEFTKEAIIESANRNNMHIVGQGNFFDKIANGEFTITQENGKNRLKVENVLVYSQSGKSSIKRTFDLEVEITLATNEIRFINN